MPHVGPVLEGHTFFCPHCGALYSATPSLVPKSEGDAARSVTENETPLFPMIGESGYFSMRWQFSRSFSYQRC